jgi:hypothetical protein
MRLSERLRRLDSRAFKSLRQPGESAEDFLRRYAASPLRARTVTPEVQQALREIFAERDAR